MPAGVTAIYGIACPSVLRCIAVGVGALYTSTVLSTDSGGASWSAVTPAGATGPSLSVVSCASLTFCIAKGEISSNQVEELRTANGGANWTSRVLPGSFLGYRSLTCVTASECLAVGGGAGEALPGDVNVTVNGGLTWTRELIPASVGELTGISCPDSVHCWAVGSTSDQASPEMALIASNDGGHTWSTQKTLPIFSSNPSISCVPGGYCWIGEGGAAETTDGGATWSVRANVGAIYVDSVACFDAQHCQAVGQGPPASQLFLNLSSLQMSGYWLLDSNSSIYQFGDAPPSLITSGTYSAITSLHSGSNPLAVTPQGWALPSGDCSNLGRVQLARPIVGLASTPADQGCWMVASDGGIFTFGDARFYGSTGNVHLNKPIVGMAPTPDGHGYWLVASDGGIFTFGDARFYGSATGHLNGGTIVGIAATA